MTENEGIGVIRISFGILTVDDVVVSEVDILPQFEITSRCVALVILTSPLDEAFIVSSEGSRSH